MLQGHIMRISKSAFFGGVLIVLCFAVQWFINSTDPQKDGAIVSNTEVGNSVAVRIAKTLYQNVGRQLGLVAVVYTTAWAANTFAPALMAMVVSILFLMCR